MLLPEDLAPERFIAIGDALCTFNPIYAQGMSAAARQADLLREVLSEHLSQARGPDGIAADFFFASNRT